MIIFAIFDFFPNFLISILSSSVISSTSISFNLFTQFASKFVLNIGKEFLTFVLKSYFDLTIPLISTSSPGLAISTKSFVNITSFCLGTLPGGTEPGLS